MTIVLAAIAILIVAFVATIYRRVTRGDGIYG
jgi:hypothetical protein